MYFNLTDLTHQLPPLAATNFFSVWVCSAVHLFYLWVYTYKWDNTIFVFGYLTYFTENKLYRCVQVDTNDKISFFVMAEWYSNICVCVCVCVCVYIYMYMYTSHILFIYSSLGGPLGCFCILYLEWESSPVCSFAHSHSVFPTLFIEEDVFPPVYILASFFIH